MKEPLPKPRLPQDFLDDPGAIHVLVDVDTLKCRMQTDNHAIRKNVSLPAWMNTLADQQGINCSKVLQEALRSKLGV